MSRILLIEDDRVITIGLSKALAAEGHETLTANNGDDGLHLAKTADPDLILLDIMMPGLNGFEITTELRRVGETVPILILSARIGSHDKVRGLDLGADDYVAKPFDLDELLARIRRLLGRARQDRQVFSGFTYDWTQRQLFRGDETVVLTTKERKLLEFFLKRVGRIVSREQVLDGVWGSDYDGTDRTVDNVIVSLRKKVGAGCLMTERGLGYRFMTKP